ncbi:dehydrogenase [Dictyobacter sp. S3.2.2.5]|uniref:Dehydrogenase n=1 Tax=Dictyobacter halimunensis TaxID=3026934 RepID=A0ABQ6G8F6_9CHLR|nr:dehydrogenase [Dictyobacter sp. S3.2.2.5]
MATKVKVGIIGTGMISRVYINGCRKFDILEIVACADIDMERARAAAQQWNIPTACTVEELLADPEIQIVINLTIPKVHAQVSLAAIAAGKSVFCEKPFAVTLEEGQRVLEAAQAKGVLLGNAPDTFLGESHQLCRKLIDEGEIGTPIAAFACFAMHAEGGGPNRDFMFQRGAGPLLDMGPYYLTDLINMLGPVQRVTGTVRTPFTEHIVQRGEHQGRRIAVETPTHITGVFDFAGGATGTLVFSYHMHRGHSLPRLEIYGTEGTISVPDPNLHGGLVRMSRGGEDWQDLPQPWSNDFTRGIGVADMAYALLEKRPNRASAELAYHVLETMLAFEQASLNGTHVQIASQPERPAPVLAGQLDRS